MRYPGGNFVSAYNWEDGVGPREKRPTRLDLAWHTSESNAVGVHEFAAWCDSAGTEMMLAINLGSRGLDEARNFVEYVNGPTGSYWGDLRKANGRAEPFGVKHWCLGNEMDGPWQVGHKTAARIWPPRQRGRQDAARLRQFARADRLRLLQLRHEDLSRVGAGRARTFLRGGRPHLAAHVFRQPRRKTPPNTSPSTPSSTPISATIASTIEFVRARKRSRKKVTISFDEWNVWYHSNAQDREILGGAKGWPHAPRLLEDVYNFEDALQVGCILNTFIRRSDVVKIACIAQLVNVIAPIMTEPNGAAWRQTIFYPYYFASVYGRGEALQLGVKSPGYDAEVADNVPYLDISGVHDEDGRTLTFFAVNRHGGETIDLDVDLQGFGAASGHRPPGDDERRPRGRQHAEEAHDRRAEGGLGRGGRGRAPDREAPAPLLPDDPPRPRVRCFRFETTHVRHREWSEDRMSLR